jgi:hypothetical protein
MKAVITIAIIAALLSMMFGHSSKPQTPEQTFHNNKVSNKCSDGIIGVAENPRGSVNYNYYHDQVNKFC